MKTTDVGFDAAADRLLSPRGEVRLPWRVARFLEMLNTAQGELVSRERAQAELWRNVIVTRNSFDQLLTQTRRCLEDAGISPTLLETVPRQGCRLKVRFASVPSALRYPYRRLAAGITLLLMAAGATWYFWPVADYVCRSRVTPVQAATGERLMHVFYSGEDFEAFQRAQQAMDHHVKVEEELTPGTAGAFIVCVEN